MFYIGKIVSGKVIGLQSYGAFIELSGGTKGLIHISECHYGYIKDIHNYFKLGQHITVMVLDIDEFTGKISLSRRCLEDDYRSSSETKIKKNEVQYKYYWTNHNVHEGFKPIQQRRCVWEQEALRNFLGK